ncbi:MAG: glycosyltransferase, partial [Marinirhabdus sp.]|nr:glycosyltransferase [Marinirhabdus sp.]
MPVLFIIGHTFPEPATTAAGRRMKQLISLFAELGYNIHFGSTAAPTKYTIDLSQIKVRVHELKLNDVSFDLLLKELKPDVVLFDRFITEEQFGWRVSDGCPEALKILDTEDLHFLRKARETAYKNDMEVTQADIFTAVAKRELASIMRCDLSLMISEVELELLTATFGIPRGLLWYVPLLVEVNNIDRDQIPTFSDRKDFIAVGNLKHAPNVASVKLLKILWPQIREKLPDAQLHIYGAYAPQELREMHSPKEGFNLMGWVDSISEVMGKAKVLLAPIPFGAGLKGKLIDAMVNGLPSVTTPMGAEGIYSS